MTGTDESDSEVPSNTFTDTRSRVTADGCDREPS